MSTIDEIKEKLSNEIFMARLHPRLEDSLKYIRESGMTRGSPRSKFNVRLKRELKIIELVIELRKAQGKNNIGNLSVVEWAAKKREKINKMNNEVLTLIQDKNRIRFIARAKIRAESPDKTEKLLKLQKGHDMYFKKRKRLP